jgi:hypothetical protein
MFHLVMPMLKFQAQELMLVMKPEERWFDPR